MRILVVDDSSFMRNMLRAVLEKAGHHVIGEASNGQEAISQYRDLNPELVILDITMPILSGLESLKEILNYNAHAKVLMCSAMGQKAIIEESIRYGAKGFITKPFKEALILDEVAKMC
ncbi:response regulator [Desulfosporosinus lacus]|uniref:Stage 0 sporulation protein A homolog n=1 Tax=Desulfosporosinus lacus DSM 15449 TaxID=1121420 RepID=A0A1M5Z7D2_9FIRM|nr:response regulator [Desulfosporosinus lacus]SHI20145.1 two-component system, chemotaxis family, response regulator CheY [Desulfosporosinus lacus DSM 15449]